MLKITNHDATIIAEMAVIGISSMTDIPMTKTETKTYNSKASIVKNFCFDAGLPKLAERIKEK